MKFKHNLPILILTLFFLSGCYIYKPYVEKDENQFQKNSSQDSRAQKLTSISPADNLKVSSVKQNQNMAVDKEELRSDEVDPAITDDTPKVVEEKMNSDQTNVNRPDASSEMGTKNDKMEEKVNKANAGKSKKSSQIVDPEPKVLEKGIKGKLQPNQYYKITALGKQYKIQVDQWEADTLVSHILRKPKKVLKFHKNDIEEETILERRFSKPFSDLFTVGAYAVGGVAVLLLVL